MSRRPVRKPDSELSKKGLKTRRYRERYSDAHNRQNRAWYAKSRVNTEKCIAASKAWKTKHAKEYKVYRDEWYVKHGEHKRAITKAYAVTNREKAAGRKKPKRCESCGKAGKICFDHNHRTGKFRGWLCVNCNFILGHAKDSKAVLRKLIVYLENGGSNK